MWVVLLILLAFCGGYLFRTATPMSDWLRRSLGTVVRWVSGDSDDAPPGRWRAFRPAAGATQQQLIKDLQSLGYVGGVNPAPAKQGVTIHDKSQAHPGWNLYSSGHAAEAFLMDMDGKVAHRWQYPLQRLWPDYKRTREVWPESMNYWRRVHLLESGDLIAIYEGIGIVKVDKASNLIWSNQCRAHHDLFVHADGTVWVLTREAHVVPRIHMKKPILEDFITVLDGSDGHVLRRTSVLECFENSSYAPMLDKRKRWGDLFHTNTLEWLDGSHAHRSAIFKVGNILICVRELDIVAIVDPAAGAVVWALTGKWLRQHDPTLVNGGQILLFDNQGHAGRSKVIEFDPFTQQVGWWYGTAAGQELFSYTCGTAQRLPNGNTLITESDNGRAIEVAADGQIAWEYVNPNRTGPNKELIATLTEVLRLPLTFPVEWLKRDAVPDPASASP